MRATPGLRALAAVLLFILSVIRGIVDVVGEAQTVSGLPILKWLIDPAFSLVAFT
jgi:hypothetical protein